MYARVLDTGVRPDTQGHFDSMLESDQVWFNCQEAALILGKSAQFIRNAIHHGHLLAHAGNMRELTKNSRKFFLIHRKHLALFLVKTANYKPPSFLKQLISIMQNCSDSEKRQLLEFLSD